MKQISQISISIIVFMLIWELIARIGLIHISLFPPPTNVVRALNEMVRSGELILDIKASIWRATIGFCCGSIIGILVGILTGRLECIHNYLSPIIQIFRPLPPVAIIPLIIVWFGIGEFSKIVAIAFAVFFPVWLNTHIGSKEIPSIFLWSAKTLKVNGFLLLLKVIFPAALPFVLAGLRMGVAIAFVMVFVSELAGASVGIGYQISVSHLSYRIDRMIASLILLGFMGAVSDLVLTRLFWILFPWLKLKTQN